MITNRQQWVGVGMLLFLSLTGFICGSSEPAGIEDEEESLDSENTGRADVVSVTVSGEDGNYTFSVGISSPDTGCEQYADWWEVLTTEGTLVYRRILTHSHVTEQPFIRSGGPVAIAPEEEVLVRAHMNPTGYGGLQYRGAVQLGFERVEGDSLFASGLAVEQPLPSSCAF